MSENGLDFVVSFDWSLCCDLCGHQIERHGVECISWTQASREAVVIPCAHCGKGRYFVQGVLFVDHAR